MLFLLLVPFSACRKQTDYFRYVSELRSNVFLSKTEDFSLRIFAVRKEIPYVADGVPQERSIRTEIYLTAPEGDKNCHLTFSCDGKEYGGDMSFDNVKSEYYFSCTLDVSKKTELVCNIQYGENAFSMTAKSVIDKDTLTPQSALNSLLSTEKELFSSLTDEYGFAGEIYLRLIYEEQPYYYVGVIDRQGGISAFLINAKTGKILAKRKS